MGFRFIIKFHDMPDYISSRVFQNRHDAIMAGVEFSRGIMANCVGHCGRSMKARYHGVYCCAVR